MPRKEPVELVNSDGVEVSPNLMRLLSDRRHWNLISHRYGVHCIGLCEERWPILKGYGMASVLLGGTKRRAGIYDLRRHPIKTPKDLGSYTSSWPHVKHPFFEMKMLPRYRDRAERNRLILSQAFFGFAVGFNRWPGNTRHYYGLWCGVFWRDKIPRRMPLDEIPPEISHAII